MKKKKLHKFVNKLVGPLIFKILKKKFNFTHEKSDLRGPFIVLCNHTMDYDAFFVSACFNNHLYFVMSDHVSSLKAGKLIKALVSPIPITKSSVDAETVKHIFEILKSGGSVGIFPEGNKSFSGEPSSIKPSIAKLVKKAGVPVVLHNIIGGYFSSPRWSKIKRKGHIHSFVREVISTKQIESMTEEELYAKIVNGLNVNAYTEQEKHKVMFEAENRAENIESLLYYCPQCKNFDTIYGEGNKIKCSKCDLDGNYNEYGYIENAPFSRLDEWDKFQKETLLKTDFESLPPDHIITKDEDFEIQKKITKYKSESLGIFKTILTPSSLLFKNSENEIKIPVSSVIGTAIEGTCSIQLSLKDGTVYRLKKELKTNGLKYVNLISRLNHIPYNF